MGQLFITDFRTHLDFSLGNRGISSILLDYWINAAYFEILGAVEFAELTEIAEIQTVAGTETVALPNGGNLLSIGGVFDLTNEQRLRKAGTDALLQFKKETGLPKYWSRTGPNLTLRPVPEGVFDLNTSLVSEPIKLSDTNTQTVLPTTWDFAIILLSTANGFFSLGEESRGWQFFQRAILYMRSRSLFEERSFDAAAMNIDFAQNPDDITRMITG